MKKLADWFSKHTPAETTLPTVNVQTALGALLVRMAKADSEYKAVEIAQIDDILAAAYHLDPVAAAKLRAQCEKLEAHIYDTDGFASLVCADLDYKDRLTVCDAAWSVLMSDGVARLTEKQTMDEIEKYLAIAHTDSYVVRQRD